MYVKLSGNADIITKLGGTAIWNLVIPEEESLPAIVFSHAAGGDENLTNIRSGNYVFLVKAVSATSLKEAGEVDDLVTACLHDVTLTVSGWANFWCMRENEVRYHEIGPGGEQYFHAGAYYRVQIEKS